MSIDLDRLASAQHPVARFIPALDHYPLLRKLLALGIFEIAFYIAYRYGMSFGQATASPFWFPDSVLLCTLLVIAPRSWWLFLLATLPVRLAVEVPPAPLWFLLGMFAIDCTKAVLAATLLKRFLSDPIRLSTMRDFGLYCLFVVVLVPASSGLAGAALRHALGHEYWASWEQWFYGDALASLIVTPLLFYWVLRPAFPRRDLFARQWLEPLLLIGGLLISTHLAFEPDSGTRGFADTRFYAPIPFLFWAALRFGMFGASGAVGLLTVFAVGTSLSGLGPFTGSTPIELAASLQQFLLLRAAPVYLAAVLFEHTRRVEWSLRESEGRFRYLADTAPVLIWMSGTDGLCVFFNKVWLDHTGRTLQQEHGEGWVDGVHPDDRERCLAVYESNFNARDSFEMDYRLRRYDGEYRWILDKGMPRYAASGEFLGYIGSAVDVTERRRQEVALRDSEERYREVVESQTDLVCRMLPDMTLTFVNEAFCRFYERDRSSLLGTNLIGLVPENAREIAADRVQSVILPRERCAWECEALHPDGSHGWRRWVCHGVFTPDGELREFQVIGHDITDRKHAEEANRKLDHAARLAAVGELTAMIAHEINQPLCAILSNAEAGEILLQSTDPPLSEVRRILADICRDDLRADEAIRRIRALMQKREMLLQPIDLNDAITSVLHLVAGDALQKRVHIRRELSSEIPPVLADRAYLEQVLLNLITNGMDAMADTAAEMRQVTVQTRRNDAETVLIAVFDRGHGISDEKMPHLFDSFFTTKAGGMGLGLSIARSIIQAHQGHIWAENCPNGGAALHFTLRVAAPVSVSTAVDSTGT